ncbi:polarity establishment/cellular polarization [Tilletia horrida]|uniref:Polarity establishment/cellular polarization n=1 Tax=Tilletia horrida TaxID=155126 RepID=A0AAN6GWM3_9BASI|nr:polarity establishment/cellular polarization [Tilletia horrida]
MRHTNLGTRLRTAALGALALLSVSRADVEVQQGLSSQLPELGHVGSPFTWTFAPDTFVETGDGSSSSSGSSASAASSSSLTFKATGLPSWASFDSDSRTFSGSPQSHDEGHATVTVTATASDGSSTKDKFSLIVVNAPAPTLKLPLAPQLPTVNGLGAQYILPDGSQYVPLGWSFSLGFSGNSFMLPNWAPIYYAATRADGSPLPSWLTFSAETFTFDGVAPVSPTPSDMAFTVKVTASNMRGYGGSSDTFNLVLTKQGLTLGHPLRAVNVTAGSSFRYQVPTTGIQLNGRQAPQDDTITVTANISPSFPWITFEVGNATLYGQPPLNFSACDSDPPTATPVSIPITFTDQNHNSVNTSILVNVFPSIFNMTSLPVVAADPGMPFNVSIGEFLRAPLEPSDIQVNLTYDPAETSQWFAFNSSNLFLSGRTPMNAVLDRVKIRIDASDELSPDFSMSSSATLAIALNGNLQDSSSSSQGDASHHQDSNGMTDRTRMALGASLGTVGGVLLLFLLILGCRKWVAEEDHDKEMYAHQDIGSFDSVDGKSPALSGTYIPHSQLRMSKGYNASQTKIKTSPYLEPTSILVAPVPPTTHNNRLQPGVVAWADHDPAGGLQRVSVGSENGSPTLNEAVAAYRQAEAVAMSGAAQRERPRQNGLLAAIFSAKKPRVSDRSEGVLITHGPYVASTASAGLGLSGLGIGGQEAGDGEAVGVRVSHSRSRHTTQSRKSSWEEGLWKEGDPRASGGDVHHHHAGQGDDVLASPQSGNSVGSSAPSIPQRRGGGNLLFGNKSGLGPMRHRNSHINDSPAFQTTGTFDTTASSGGGVPLSESRQRMFDEAKLGLEQRVLSVGAGLQKGSNGTTGGGSAAAGVNVRQVGTRHPISIEESKLRTVSHAVSSEGAFEDADEGMGYATTRDDDDADGLQEELSTAEIVAAGRALTTESAMQASPAHLHRHSTLSYTTNHDGDRAVQGAAIFTEPALKTVPTFSVRPEETMRAVGDVKTIRY